MQQTERISDIHQVSTALQFSAMVQGKYYCIPKKSEQLCLGIIQSLHLLDVPPAISIFEWTGPVIAPGVPGFVLKPIFLNGRILMCIAHCKHFLMVILKCYFSNKFWGF